MTQGDAKAKPFSPSIADELLAFFHFLQESKQSTASPLASVKFVTADELERFP